MHVDILIGLDFYGNFIGGLSRKLNDGTMHVNSSSLGQILFGLSADGKSFTSKSLNVQANPIEDNLQEIMERFWSIESLGIVDSVVDTKRSASDEEALQHFEDTVKFENGKYVVSLPWKENVELNDNRNQAIVRLKQLE